MERFFSLAFWPCWTQVIDGANRSTQTWGQVSHMFKSNKTSILPFYSCGNKSTEHETTGVMSCQPLIHFSRQTLSSLPSSTICKPNWKNIHTCTPVLPDAPPNRHLFLRNLRLEWVKCFLLLLGAKRKSKWVVYPREWLNQLECKPSSPKDSLSSHWMRWCGSPSPDGGSSYQGTPVTRYPSPRPQPVPSATPEQGPRFRKCKCDTSHNPNLKYPSSFPLNIH